MHPQNTYLIMTTLHANVYNTMMGDDTFYTKCQRGT